MSNFELFMSIAPILYYSGDFAVHFFPQARARGIDAEAWKVVAVRFASRHMDGAEGGGFSDAVKLLRRP